VVEKNEIMEKLKKVKYPGFSRDIVSFGLIREIIFDKNKLRIKILFSTEDDNKRNLIIDNIRNELSSYNFDEVEFEVLQKKLDTSIKKTPFEKGRIEGVKHIIAVASGKGGVGKSLVAVNLASSLSVIGYRVGIMDADIYGPSIPIMLNIKERPKAIGDRIIPIEKFNMQVISIGFFLKKDDEAVIWRGPMVMKAVEELLFDVQWGELDFLIVDLPPGTGDAQLTLAQKVHLSGVIIVTTPQDVALIDARKGVNMFKKINTPILGIIENMSYFVCPHCNKRTDIFSHGGGKRASEELQVEYLGNIPLIPNICEQSDKGEPIPFQRDDTEYKQFFLNLAARIAQDLMIESMNK